MRGQSGAHPVGAVLSWCCVGACFGLGQPACLPLSSARSPPAQHPTALPLPPPTGLPITTGNLERREGRVVEPRLLHSAAGGWGEWAALSGGRVAALSGPRAPSTPTTLTLATLTLASPLSHRPPYRSLAPPPPQVLISIQSLILVDEPFYNEPGAWVWCGAGWVEAERGVRRVGCRAAGGAAQGAISGSVMARPPDTAVAAAASLAALPQATSSARTTPSPTSTRRT